VSWRAEARSFIHGLCLSALVVGGLFSLLACTARHPDCADICLRAHSPECKAMDRCLTDCVDRKRRE